MMDRRGIMQGDRVKGEKGDRELGGEEKAERRQSEVSWLT